MSSRFIHVVALRLPGRIIFHGMNIPHFCSSVHPSVNTWVVCGPRLLWVMLPWMRVQTPKSSSSYFLKPVAKLFVCLFVLLSVFLFDMIARKYVQSQNCLPWGQGITLVHFSNQTVLWDEAPGCGNGCRSLARRSHCTPFLKVRADPASHLPSTIQQKLCSLRLPKGHQKARVGAWTWLTLLEAMRADARSLGLLLETCLSSSLPGPNEGTTMAKAATWGLF